GGPGGRPSLASRERWISGEEAISPECSIPDGVSLRGDGVWGRRGLLERNRSGLFGNRPDRTALDDLPPGEPPGGGEPLLPKRIFSPSIRRRGRWSASGGSGRGESGNSRPKRRKFNCSCSGSDMKRFGSISKRGA